LNGLDESKDGSGVVADTHAGSRVTSSDINSAKGDIGPVVLIEKGKSADSTLTRSVVNSTYSKVYVCLLEVAVKAAGAAAKVRPAQFEVVQGWAVWGVTVTPVGTLSTVIEIFEPLVAR
jgi:hypothetical protein